jgi:hypothetical protein
VVSRDGIVGLCDDLCRVVGLWDDLCIVVGLWDEWCRVIGLWDDGLRVVWLWDDLSIVVGLWDKWCRVVGFWDGLRCVMMKSILILSPVVKLAVLNIISSLQSCCVRDSHLGLCGVVALAAVYVGLPGLKFRTNKKSLTSGRLGVFRLAAFLIECCTIRFVACSMLRSAKSSMCCMCCYRIVCVANAAAD